MALSFVLADEYDSDVEHVLTSVSQSGALVPAVWAFEVFNGLRSAERRGRITDAGVTHAVRGLERLPIEQDRRPLDGVSLISLARRLDLSVYDASYVWLAMEANLPLASRDQTLTRAASAVGISLLPDVLGS